MSWDTVVSSAVAHGGHRVGGCLCCKQSSSVGREFEWRGEKRKVTILIPVV
jgi:hypothetical protein